MRDVGLVRWRFVAFLATAVVLFASCNKQTDGGTGAATSASAVLAPAPPIPAEPPRVEITLASGQDPTFVVLDKGYVYWLNGDTDADTDSVLRVPVNGGNPTVVASHQHELSTNGRFAVYGDNVYWIREEGRDDHARRAVVSAPARGGAVHKVASAGVLAGALAVDASGVFWIDTKDSGDNDQGAIGMLKHVLLSGGKVTTLAVEPTNGEAADVLLDAQYAYWSQVDFVAKPGAALENHLVRAPREGGNAVELAAFGYTSPIRALALDGASVFVADAADFKSPGTISVVPKSGGTPRVLAKAMGPGALAVDGDYVYFVSNSITKSPGFVGRLAKQTGEMLVLANDQPHPTSIALDDSFVYWTNAGEGIGAGTVKKIHK